MNSLLDFDGLDGEIRWALIEVELEEFQSLLSDAVPKLQIERTTDVLEWESKIGVYFLFDENEQLIWIGFTLDRFGKRISSHRQDKSWCWTDLIVFDDNFEFLAPALETFLRHRLLPLLDGGGKHV